MITSEYEKCLNAVHQELVAVDSVCLNTDTWTSMNVQSSLGVTAHYITENFELRSILLECSFMSLSHTSSNLADQIRCIVEKFKLTDKVSSIVTEFSYNITGAMTKELEENHFPCFAHTLNLILQDALKNAKELIDKIKRIVSFFKRSSSGLEKLYSVQKNNLGLEPKKFIQEVPTRWNSTFYMIQRFFELQDAIKTTIVLINKDLPVLTEDEWVICNELCTVLEPFGDVTKQICGEHYVTGSLIIPLVDGLRCICEDMQKENFNPTVKSVVNELLSGINSRMTKLEDNQSLHLATFLDPRFKLAPFVNELLAKSIKGHCTDLLSNIWSQQQNVYNAGDHSNEDDDFNQGEISNNCVEQSAKFNVWGRLDNRIASTKSPGMF